MKIAKSLDEFQTQREGCSGRVGFVPTMGALHEGHLSLVRLASQHAQSVIVSIFVNPTQFAPGEDFEAYPRDLGTDLELLEAAGVDLVFAPQERDIYPRGREISVKAGAAAQGLESDFRPHFFDGVCSVVHRLFEIVRPDVAVFGEKDYQQLMVIREMVATQGLGIEIVGAAIARDEYGLALSSRNAYLSADEIEVARKLNVFLNSASSRRAAKQAQISGIHKDADSVGDISGSPPSERGKPRRGDDEKEGLNGLKAELIAAGFDKVDYIEERWGRILAAAWIGKTRLIDNVSKD